MESSPPLLLIFGLPRSGTTWLAKIFDSHPETLYRHEPDRFPQLESIPRFPSVDEADAHAEFLHRFAAELPQRNESNVVAKLPLFPKTWQSRFDYNAMQASVLLSKLGERAHLKLPVLGVRPKQSKSPSLVVWKSIESMGRFGLVIQALDNAKGIHLLRHPCGHINSILRGEGRGKFQGDFPNSELYRLFGNLVQTPQAQRRGLTLQYLRSVTPVQRLAWRWVLVNEKAIEDTRGNDRIMTVCYEHICADPLGVARNLFDFSELAWCRQTETFVSQSVDGDKQAYYSVYKAPQHSMAKWREQLAIEDREQILAILKDSSLSRFYNESNENVH